MGRYDWDGSRFTGTTVTTARPNVEAYKLASAFSGRVAPRRSKSEMGGGLRGLALTRYP